MESKYTHGASLGFKKSGSNQLLNTIDYLTIVNQYDLLC